MRIDPLRITPPPPRVVVVVVVIIVVGVSVWKFVRPAGLPTLPHARKISNIRYKLGLIVYYRFRGCFVHVGLRCDLRST